MTPEKISEALEVLAWFNERVISLPERRDEAVPLSLHISIVNLALGELGLRLAKGEDAYDALRSAVVGEHPIDPAKMDVLRALLPPLPRPGSGE